MDFEVNQMQSKAVTSPQPGIHNRLLEVVNRHRQSVSMRPVPTHSQAAFEALQHWLADRSPRPIILDSCCGVGQSTAMIAQMHPDAWVIGVDKSGVRLEKHHAYANAQDNYLLLRADLFDLWKLLNQHQFKLTKHFLLYPTPWPKPAHLQRRWYASNAFPFLVELGGELTVRSNWALYVQECAAALKCYGIESQIRQFESEAPLTPFERKYQASGQPLWQLSAQLKPSL